jgi:hypothetical protein
MKSVNFGILPEINFSDVINHIDIIKISKSKSWILISFDNGVISRIDLKKYRYIYIKRFI